MLKILNQSKSVHSVQTDKGYPRQTTQSDPDSQTDLHQAHSA